MASVETLSDSELRQKLIDYGYPVGPVTQTTRRTFEKKLAQFMSQDGKPAKDSVAVKQPRNLSRFSSAEEDSDDGAVSRRKTMPPPASNVVKRKSLGRSARAAEAAREAESKSHSDETDTTSSPSREAFSTLPAQQPSRAGRSRYSVGGEIAKKTAAKSLNNSNSRNSRPSRKSIATSAPSRSVKSAVDPFDSDSDVPLAALANRTSSLLSSLRRDEDDDEDDDLQGEDDDEDDDSRNKPITSLLSNMSSRFLPDTEPVSSALGTSDLSFKHRLGVARENPFEIKENPTPYLSAFAHRLSQLKAHSLSSSNAGHSSLVDDVKESDASDGSFQSSDSPNGNYYNKRSPPRSTRTRVERVDTSKYRPQLDANSVWKNTHVLSFLILGGFIIFAVGLGILYVNVTSKEVSTLKEKLDAGNTYKICKNGSESDVPKVTCVKEKHLQPAKNLFDSVHQILLNQVIKSKCGPPNEDGTYAKPSLTEHEVTAMVIDQKSLSIWEAEEGVANLVVLLELNPHWGISVLDGMVRQTNKTSLQLTSPPLPLACVIRNRAYEAVGYLLFVVAGGVVAYAIWQGSNWWFKQRERNRQEVYRYVENIIEVLINHQQNLRPGDDPYLAINHVRDQLIAPYDRQRLKSVWDAAVKFIEEKESRVRVEIQPVNGEDYKVWRWLTPSSNPGSPVSLGSSLGSPLGGRRKVWQGQAFETIEGSVNSLPVSPTPCLKVRHMFDVNSETGDNWPQQVKDAILEKCEKVRILHIEVDRNSKEGCVYIKCASNEDAGKAYKALHGSWFDSQLVTVKYIRLERYHERFPASVRSVRPLRRN